ncbi:DUF4870 domain-containing protein [Agromyces aurantiacus]|uniref:DUF4870 domain-containing protein n=1 Tax=Agromyces aurantiacus TaxID=165814 RepID=A0ABV9R8U0_9MICO|nr:DUF4870 domain-containing protein [Agromyces aurantiacus]MBM7504642.1 putative Tic20 family protein [Agromyces aurantiacus]
MTDPNVPPHDPNAAPQPATAPAAPLSHEQDVQWGSFAHLGGILGFLPSLIIWLVFKDRGAFTNTEAKEALNFQITAVFAYIAIFIVNAILTVVTLGIWGYIGWLLPTALWIAVIVFSVLGFMQAKEGRHYRYPFAIRLIK